MYEKFGQFINGKWGPSSDNGTYEVINPATEEVLGQASKATPQNVNEALNAAKNGLEVWKKTPPWQRSYIFEKLLTR
jgi:succinate-semialdehyde dehydrogenase/glutarate-semialdehyde dehydrogenase